MSAARGGQHSGDRERIAERRDKVFSLMRGGVVRRRALAQALHVAASTIQRDINAVLKELRAKTSLNAEAMRDLGVARCDGIIAALWPERKKPPAALAILKAEERRARLHGLDAPTKIAPTTPDGGQPYDPLHVYMPSNFRETT